MNILLIAPASGAWHHVGRAKLINGKTFRFSLLSLLSVAAETPARDSVLLIDEQIDDIPWNADVDLVGITCMTALAPRAYEIADRFRALGIPVVLGGMHPTFRPVEALEHADAVVVGEAEGVWGRVVEDARAGCARGEYRAEAPPDLAFLKPPPRHLLRAGQYSTVNAIQATRGCPHACAFCAVSAFSGATHRRRPVEAVAREAASLPGHFFILVDDNLTADRDYALALFRALEPLDKFWVTQSTLAVSDDESFVRSAARSGCIGLFVGVETFTESNLMSVEKTCHRVEKYRDSMARLHRHGIAVEAGIVFGFDGDDPGVFENTLRMLDDLEIDAIQASILTPLPGTPRFDSMTPRLIDLNWSHYDLHHVVFQPAGMSVEALQAGHDWTTRAFYSPLRIARRSMRHLTRPRGARSLPYVAGLNLAYHGRIASWHIRGWNPADEYRASNGSHGLSESLFARASVSRA